MRPISILVVKLVVFLTFVSCNNRDEVNPQGVPRTLFIIAGQSNAIGTAELSELNDLDILGPVENAYILNGDSFELMNIGVNNRKEGADNFFGPEIGFVQNSRRPSYVVKVGAGGTSLVQDWGPESALRYELINAITRANNIYPFTKVVIYWNQFERDATLQEHEAYGEALESFFDDVQRRSNTRFDMIILAKVNPNSRPGATEAGEQIMQSQIDFVNANPRRRYLLNLDHLTFNNVGGPNLHYDSESQLRIGETLAEIVNNNLRKPVGEANILEVQ